MKAAKILFKKHIFLAFAIILPPVYISSLYISNYFDFPLSIISGPIGLFVPFGIINTVESKGIGLIIYIPVAIVIDCIFSKAIHSFTYRLILSLLALLVITFYVDRMIWGEWYSADIVFGWMY